MKKLLLIAAALTISISGFSQKKETSKIIIAGNLKNYGAREVRIWNLYKQFFTTPIEGGNFKYTLDAEESGIYTIQIIDDRDFDLNLYIEELILHGERSQLDFFLSPGDSIYLSADFLNFNGSFSIKGDNETENTYLFEKQRIYSASISGKIVDFLRNGEVKTALMGLEKEKYFHKKDSLFNAFRNKFEALKATNTLDPDFIKLEEAYLQYEPLVLDLYYSSRHAIIHGLMDKTTGYYNKDDIDFPIDKVNADLAKVDLNRSDLLSSRPYTLVVKRRIDGASNEIMKQDSTLKNNSEGFHKANMMAIDQLLTNQAVKDHFQFYNIKRDLQSRGPVNARADYDKFMQDNQSPTLAAKLKESLDKWDTILPGMEVPDFSFVDIEGNSVKLSELRGNLVYIDIWATWCGPCIAEHPHWDKLREEYKDQAVSFLTISVDFKREPWEKMVKSKKMEGLQWYAPESFNSEIIRFFMVNGIPRFILLDLDGKIIDPSADRPSGDIRAILDQHL